MADLLYTEDYVVEQGTDGIWTYRKWASGIAECWGISTWNGTVTYEIGNMYVCYNSEYISGVKNGTTEETIPLLQVTYPTKIGFIEVTQCTYSLDANYSLWASANSQYADDKLSKSPLLYIYRPTILGAAADVEISWQVKGRWK